MKKFVFLIFLQAIFADDHSNEELINSLHALPYMQQYSQDIHESLKEICDTLGISIGLNQYNCQLLMEFFFPNMENQDLSLLTGNKDQTEFSEIMKINTESMKIILTLINRIFKKTILLQLYIQKKINFKLSKENPQYRIKIIFKNSHYSLKYLPEYNQYLISLNHYANYLNSSWNSTFSEMLLKEYQLEFLQKIEEHIDSTEAPFNLQKDLTSCGYWAIFHILLIYTNHISQYKAQYSLEEKTAYITMWLNELLSTSKLTDEEKTQVAETLTKLKNKININNYPKDKEDLTHIPYIHYVTFMGFYLLLVNKTQDLIQSQSNNSPTSLFAITPSYSLKEGPY